MSNNPSHANNVGSAGHYERQSPSGRAEFIAQQFAQVAWWRDKLIAATSKGDMYEANDCLEEIRGIYAMNPEIVADLNARLLANAEATV